MAKVSAESYYYTMTRLNTLNEKEARLKVVEEERATFKKELSNFIKKNGRLRKDLDAQVSASKQEEARFAELFTTKDAVLSDALADVTDLQAEISSLKAERSKIKSDVYTEGFQGYLKGFLAVAPEYDWSKFGKGTSKWLDESKVLEAEAISLKKAQIATEQKKVSDASEALPKVENTSTLDPSSATS